MSLLTLSNVAVNYGRIRAVRRASLHVNQGEIVALIGSNGAGKTTLLSAISGVVRPVAGTEGGSVAFDGRDITRERAERIVAMGVSQAPEGRHIWGPLTVEDNLDLGAFTRPKADREAIKADKERCFAIFPKLKERRLQLAGTLSGGEQQMLAIGRALMAKPRLLLLDEPSMGLAPTITREIFEHVTALREGGLTVLLVEQNARHALKIADRGYVLETGRIVLQGPAAELLENRDVQRAYLGRDPDPAP